MYTSTLVYGLVAIASSTVSARSVPEQSLAKRHAFGTSGQCEPQPLGSGPVAVPDTAEGFTAYSVFSEVATNAPTPDGWSVVYQDLQAASTTTGYLGNEEIDTYDVGYCAKQCCEFWTGCTSFNIYFERDPSIDPGDQCPNPSSTTRIKCSFWSTDIVQGDATNDGQYCADFHVVIAGSNAYKGGCGKSTTTTTTTATTTTTSTTSTTTTPVTTTTTKAGVTTTTTKAGATTSTTTTKAASTTTTKATSTTTTKCTTTTKASSTSTKITTTTTKAPTTTTTKAAATTAAGNKVWEQWLPKKPTSKPKKICTWWGYCYYV